MIDFSTDNMLLQSFTRPCSVAAGQAETWRKPLGISMIYMLLIGGGGGGGGGFKATSGTARGGGGGGGSGACVTLAIPAFLLPDVLYIQVGAGGIGVDSGGGTAGSGIRSFVAVKPDTAAENMVAISGAADATGGGTGTAAAAGAAGVGGTVAAIANMPLGGLGLWNAYAGMGGGTGGPVVGGAGTSLAIPTTGIMVMGGSGGGGGTNTNNQGGGVSATAGTLLSDVRPPLTTAGFNHGAGGHVVRFPFFVFGGSGGGMSDTTSGGFGGNGIYGSGGGGGGAGAVAAGVGGDGGSGLVLIYGW